MTRDLLKRRALREVAQAVGLSALLLAVAIPACSDAEFRASNGGRGGSAGSSGGSAGSSGSGGSAGSAGSSGSAGSAGRDASPGGQGGTAGKAGSDAGPDAAGAGGSAGAPDASTDAPADAPPDVIEAGPACDVTTQFFRDSDRDGYGDDANTVRACVAPPGRWVLVGGDCQDELGDVFPNQPLYFGTAYETKNGMSFDYDCSGVEEPDNTQPGAAPTSCPLLCANPLPPPGYFGTTRTSPLNPLCGSDTIVSCSGGLNCTPKPAPTDTPKRCH